MFSWTVVTVIIISIYCLVWFVLKRVIHRPCTSKRNMLGKTVIITGANCGIGKATAQELVMRHARVIMACRDINKATSAAKDIRKVTKNGEIIVKKLDLLSLKSVRQFCDGIVQEERRIDVLIHNAGVFNHPFMITEDDLEVHMSVNHFANFLMTHLLLDRMRSSAPSRIVFVNSFFYKQGKFDVNNLNNDSLNSKKIFKYPDSKLANIYFARELDRRLKGTGIGVHVLNPGMVHTQISRYTTPSAVEFILAPISFLLKTPLEGCQTVLHCALSEELDNVSGLYYNNCKEEDWNEISSDEVIGKKIWELSERLTGIDHSEIIR